MKGGKQPLGYTIIEVMIVLAVSGVMFLIASSFINGKEESTAFTQGVHELSAQIQDVISQVDSGQYANLPLNCYSSPTLGFVTFGAGASPGQGANSACTFLGKVIHFSVNGMPNDYEVISVAGSRLNSQGNPNVATTPPAPYGADAQYIPSLTYQQATPQNLQVETLEFINVYGAKKFSYGLGFLESLPTNNATDSVLNNGGQTVGIYYVTGLTSTMGGDTGDQQGEEQINPNPSTSVRSRLRPANSAEICVTDGMRWADIDIGRDTTSGSNSGQLNVTVNIDPSGPTEPVVCQ
jgi:prepilin-type N-terminal cleavage/methylation domain-containing protein